MASYYVHPSLGNDDLHNGLAIEAEYNPFTEIWAGAFKTIGKAVDASSNGDEIFIKGGYTYKVNAGNIPIDLSGNGVTIQAFPADIGGGEPIIIQDTQSDSSCDMFTIENGDSVVRTYTFKNLTLVMTSGGNTAIKIEPTGDGNTDSIVIKGCNFFGGYKPTEDISTASLIQRTAVHQIISVTEEFGPSLDIYDCAFSNWPIAIEGYFTSKDRTKFQRCIFYECGDNGMKNEVAAIVAKRREATGAPVCLVQNNLFMGCEKYAIYKTWQLYPTVIEVDNKTDYTSVIGADVSPGLTDGNWVAGDGWTHATAGTGEVVADWESTEDIGDFYFGLSGNGLITGKMYRLELTFHDWGNHWAGIGVQTGMYTYDDYPNGWNGDGDYGVENAPWIGQTENCRGENSPRMSVLMLADTGGVPESSGGTELHVIRNKTVRHSDHSGHTHGIWFPIRQYFRYFSDMPFTMIFQKEADKDTLTFRVTSQNGNQSPNPRVHDDYYQTGQFDDPPYDNWYLGLQRERFQVRINKIQIYPIFVHRRPFRNISQLDFRPPKSDDRIVPEVIDYGPYGTNSVSELDGEINTITMTNSYILPHEARRVGGTLKDWEDDLTWETMSDQVDLPSGKPWTQSLICAVYDDFFVKSNYNEAFFVQWDLSGEPTDIDDSTDKTTTILFKHDSTKEGSTGVSAVSVPYSQIPGWYNLHGTDNYGGRTAKMTAGKHDITIEQGANFKRTFSWKDSAAAPVTLVGYTVKMNIKGKKSDSSALYSDAGTHITLGGTAGTVDVNIPAATTGALDFDWGYWDIELTKTSTGDVTRLLEGKVSLSKQVTTV